jgi:two-component system, LuxR family, response regulator FixJ
MTQDRATVFIVDDDASVRKALRRLLCVAGYDVETFDGAAAFLQQPAPSRPRSCLVLDIRMRGMSGLELQQTLGDTGRALPIVLITGHEDTAARARSLTSGAVDVLCKPLDERVLLQAIERALSRTQ